jgi:Mn2+/Fe2+ NRAMP family transporter
LAGFTVGSKANLVNYNSDTNYTAIVEHLVNAKLVCDLDQYSLTKQIYLKCHETSWSTKIPNPNQLYNTKIEAESSLVNVHLKSARANKMVFLILENDNLFPTWPHKNTTLDMINLVEYKRLQHKSDQNKENKRTCAQIFSIIQQNGKASPHVLSSTLNLTLEIKMPSFFYKILNSAQFNLKLNKTKATIREKNLFDQIFLTRDDDHTDSDNGNDSLVDETAHLDFVLNDEDEMFKFKKNFYENWLNLNNYEIVYGLVENKYIKWSNQPAATSLIRRCILQKLKTNYKQDHTLFAKLNCQIATTNSSNSTTNIQEFISLRHRNSIESSSNQVTKSPYDELFNAYAHLFNFNLDLHGGLLSNYALFDFRIVYFSSGASCLLLLTSALVYALAGPRRLMMPRSFRHVYINIWSSVLLLASVYSLGIRQVSMPRICLSTAVLLHYLTLSCSCWYTLYFYCLYQKLRSLRKNNFNLMFNRDERHVVMKRADDNAAAATDAAALNIKKSVVHLYMLGWGLPALLCSIIVAISKRDYVQVPFGRCCFTNEFHILVGGLLAPVVGLLCVKFVLLMVICCTLRAILFDLKLDAKNRNGAENEEDNSDEQQSKPGLTVEEMNDKVELCKRWANKSKAINGLLNGPDHLIEAKIVSTTTNLIKPNKNEASSSGSFNPSFDQDEDMCGDTSFNSNISAQTSIMDAQYKPQVQLNFSFFLLVMLMFVWLLASCIAYGSSGINMDNTNNRLISLLSSQHSQKIFSYLFSIALFVYSMCQFSFYVLSRDEFSSSSSSYCGGNCFNNDKMAAWLIPKWVEKCSVFKVDKIVREDLPPLQINQNAWYFEAANNEQEKFAFKSQDQQNENESRNLISETNDEEGEVSASDDQVEKEHKESICDIIFSAKKSLSQPSATTSRTMLNNSEFGGLVDGNRVESADENPDDQAQMDELSSSSEAESKDSNNETTLTKTQNSKVPTLAIQEDLTEYSSSTTTTCYSQIIQKTAKNPTLSHSNSTTLQLAKKPAYVYIDYKYEDKMLDKLIAKSPQALPRKNMNNNNNNNNNNGGKLNDLFNTSCSANTGTALDSIRTSSLSSTINTISQSGSSSISSSNDILTNNNNNTKTIEESQYQLISYEDRLKYQQYLQNSAAKRAVKKTQPTNLESSAMLLQRANTLIRPKHEKEAKHETSV